MTRRLELNIQIEVSERVPIAKAYEVLRDIFLNIVADVPESKYVKGTIACRPHDFVEQSQLACGPLPDDYVPKCYDDPDQE